MKGRNRSAMTPTVAESAMDWAEPAHLIRRFLDCRLDVIDGWPLWCTDRDYRQCFNGWCGERIKQFE